MLNLTNVTIQNGFQGGYGNSGAGINNNGGLVILVDCNLLNNTAERGYGSNGGGITSGNGGRIRLQRCTFFNNFAEQNVCNHIYASFMH